MVFFTCNHCGESVKKPAVEKHYNSRCRGAVKNVSCMDCLKDFLDEEYVAHTKCITEAEKYSGKDYVHKEPKNSGAKKQESWMDTIRSILDSSEYKLSAQARSAFQRLQSVDNVPRKQAKFQNFVANCMRMPKSLSEEVWNVLEQEQTKIKQSKKPETGGKTEASAEVATKEDDTEGKRQNGVKRVAEKQNGAEEKSKKKKLDESGQTHAAIVSSAGVDPVVKKSKNNKGAMNGEPTGDLSGKQAVNCAKDKENDDGTHTKKKPKQKKTAEQEQSETKVEAAADSTTAQTNTDTDEEFQWSATLEKIVAKHAGDGISLEKLKKRLLKKYLAKLGVASLTEKQEKKFAKKFTKNLKKCATVLVDGEVAKPC